MTGKLDEISEAIGGLRASTSGLEKTFHQHCLDDDRRHLENLTAIRDLTETLRPIAAWAQTAKPELEAMRISNWKKAGAISLAGMILASIAWIVEVAAGHVLKWLSPH